MDWRMESLRGLGLPKKVGSGSRMWREQGSQWPAFVVRPNGLLDDSRMVRNSWLEAQMYNVGCSAKCQGRSLDWVRELSRDPEYIFEPVTDGHDG